MKVLENPVRRIRGQELFDPLYSAEGGQKVHTNVWFQSIQQFVR
jgi:hypothetical protein